jgi:transcriptional regulator with XRE-family HTH domain
MAWREHARAASAAPRPITEQLGHGADSQAGGTRAKTIKLELSRAARRAREAAGITQEQLASAIDTSRANTRRWEDTEHPMSPSIAHLAIAPRDYALPLLAYAARQHAHEVLAAPVVEQDAAALEAEARAACLDLLRAFEASCERKRGELIERAALRVANASRAVLAARNCR